MAKDKGPIIKKRPKKKRSSGSGRGRNISLIIFILVFLSLIVAVPYYFFVPKEETFALKQFRMATVTTRDFVNSVPATGTVVAEERAVVEAPASGIIVDILFETGDQIKEGDLLAELSSEQLEEELEKAKIKSRQLVNDRKQIKLDYQQAMDQLNQKLKENQENYEKLKDKLVTWEELYKLGEISEAKLESEKEKLTNIKQTLSDLKQEKEYKTKKHRITIEDMETSIKEYNNKVEDIEEDIKATKIRADFDGKVVEIPVKVGDELKENQKVAEIVNEDSLIVKAKVNLEDIELVEEDKETTITAGGKTYPAKVEHISSVADGSKVDVDVVFDQVPNNLRVNTEVSVDIEVYTLEDRPALPRGRYLTSGQETYVYKIEGDKAVKTEVSFGLINGNYIEVKSGLDKGDKILAGSYDDFIHLDEIEINPEGGIKI